MTTKPAQLSPKGKKEIKQYTNTGKEGKHALLLSSLKMDFYFEYQKNRKFAFGACYRKSFHLSKVLMNVKVNGQNGL